MKFRIVPQQLFCERHIRQFINLSKAIMESHIIHPSHKRVSVLASPDEIETNKNSGDGIKSQSKQIAEMDPNTDIKNMQYGSNSNNTKLQSNFLRPKRKTKHFVRKLLVDRKYLFRRGYSSSISTFFPSTASSLVSLFVILSLIQLLGYGVKDVNANMISEESKYGLTAYAEPCTDECKQRGFPYTWCHKKASRNGTWIDRDYCSPGPGLTRYLEPCLESCHQDKKVRSGNFYWCKTSPTARGNWDYCSPYPR